MNTQPNRTGLSRLLMAATIVATLILSGVFVAGCSSTRRIEQGVSTVGTRAASSKELFGNIAGDVKLIQPTDKVETGAVARIAADSKTGIKQQEDILSEVQAVRKELPNVEDIDQGFFAWLRKAFWSVCIIFTGLIIIVILGQTGFSPVLKRISEWVLAFIPRPGLAREVAVTDRKILDGDMSVQEAIAARRTFPTYEAQFLRNKQ